MNSASSVISSSTASGGVNSTNTQTKTQSTKTSDKSFDEEMKTAQKPEETKEVKETKDTNETDKSSKETKTNDTKTENKETVSQNLNEEEIVPHEFYNGEISYADFKYHNEGQSVLARNIQSLLDTKDLMNTISLAQTIEYDSINMSDDDANFFANLVQNTDMSMKGISNEINSELVQNNQNVQKNVQVSSVLMEKLADSLRTNQPFRIDFDKDVSVIIKVNKDGSLSANFIPGDKAVEQYLRNNIESLRQRFDEEDLPYSQLSYSNSKEGKQQQRSKKENDNE